MGVSVRTVRRMTAAGMPSETWGMGRTRRYLPSQAMGWAAARAKMTAVNPSAARQRRRAAPRGVVPMPTQWPSGRWRPRIRHPRTGKHLNPQAVIGGPSSYEHEHDARRAEVRAASCARTPGSA